MFDEVDPKIPDDDDDVGWHHFFILHESVVVNMMISDLIYHSYRFSTILWVYPIMCNGRHSEMVEFYCDSHQQFSFTLVVCVEQYDLTDFKPKSA